MTTFQDDPNWEETDEVSSLEQWLKEVEDRVEDKEAHPFVFSGKHSCCNSLSLAFKMLKRAVATLRSIEDQDRDIVSLEAMDALIEIEKMMGVKE